MDLVVVALAATAAPASTKNGIQSREEVNLTRMDDPKTRRESKKSAKDKAKGKDTCYSSKHVRQLEALKAKQTK